MTKLLAHFQRVGGVLISPRATLSRLIFEREGNLLELVPWIAFVAVIIAPAEAGRALLWFRINWWEGLSSTVTMLSNRMALPLGVMLAVAIVLFVGELIFRSGEERRGLDAALDAAAFGLVPYLFLATLGALLSALGLELWWLPHRSLRGVWSNYLLRIAVAFGWCAILWGFAASYFWRKSTSPPAAG